MISCRIGLAYFIDNTVEVVVDGPCADVNLESIFQANPGVFSHNTQIERSFFMAMLYSK